MKTKKLKTLSTSVVGIDGKSAGNLTLPAELFAAAVNKHLLATAVRVYLANQRKGTASTKTRGEVEGSTRKIYRQKGTGRARHGAIRAPIFVGGGIVFGPKPRDFSLKLSKKMKKAAIAAALTAKYQEGKVSVISGLEKVEPKTKLVAPLLKSSEASSLLLIVVPQAANLIRASRNLIGVDILPANNLNPYQVLVHEKLVLMKEAVALLKKIYATNT